MNLVYLTVFLASLALSQAKRTTVSCSFQLSKGSSDGWRRTTCGYRRAWDGMHKASWNIVTSNKGGGIRDRSTDGGYFAYFQARRRPIGHVSRFISPLTTFPDDDTCVSFYYINKGKTKESYPEGRSKLQVFLVDKGKPPRNSDVPLWSGTKRTSGRNWKRAEVPLFKAKTDHLGANRKRQSLVFVALRGKSDRSIIAIDDITVHPCNEETSILPNGDTYIVEEPAKLLKLAPEIKPQIISDANDLFRQLAAQRPVHTREFSALSGSVTEADSPLTLPPSADDAKISDIPPLRQRARSRGGRRHRGRERKPKKKYGVVYFTEQPDQELSASEGPFIPTLISQEPRSEVLCDFMEYTHRLKKCLRAFFSMLKQPKSSNKCDILYLTLEKCLQTSATQCVPSHDMAKQDIETLISDTLRNKFKTQQVYCQEEGAFVYPEFALGTLPLQCTREYFMKLTQCGGAFSGFFNIKHGDPKLCSEYFKANECQRQTTADECNFETRTMLVYGLNLQYQFAHNPFCIDLPFSAWWPRK